MQLTWQKTSTRLTLAVMLCLLTLVPLFSTPASAAEPGVIAQATAEGSSLFFQQATEYESVILSVRGPKRTSTEETYADGKDFEWSLYDSKGRVRPDGVYTFELRAIPHVDSEAKEMLRRARLEGNEDEVFVALCEEGRVTEEPLTQSGVFHVVKSQVLLSYETEKGAEGNDSSARQTRDAGTSISGIETSPDKQVISGDLTVYNSACIGFDCATNETYSFDTLRLKENNLRIHFDDTSTAGSYPRTDWRLEANAQTNGGSSHFAIQDATANRNILIVRASAPANSLYINNNGNVGLGTSTPTVELHVADGDSPALRLDQNGSSGFQPQAWDLAGNETSFFLRDVTNGSTLPFRVFPNNASNILNIRDDNVGIGTISPDEDLHIARSGVPIGVKLQNTTDDRNWTFKLSGSGFAINEDAEASTLLLRDNGEVRIGNDGAEEFVIRSNGDTEIDGNLDVDGDISATGMISDRDRKQQITDVDGGEVLAKVLAMPVTTWVYNHQTEVRHIGPMAQDFHAAFGLGTERSIGLGDLGGLSLAAIQELNAQFEQKLEAKDAQIDQLQQRLEALEAALLELQKH